MPIATTITRGKSIKFSAGDFKDEDGNAIVPTGVTLRYRQNGEPVVVAMANQGASWAVRIQTADLAKGKLFYSVSATDGTSQIREDGQIDLTGNLANPEA